MRTLILTVFIFMISPILHGIEHTDVGVFGPAKTEAATSFAFERRFSAESFEANGDVVVVVVVVDAVDVSSSKRLSSLNMTLSTSRFNRLCHFPTT